MNRPEVIQQMREEIYVFLIFLILHLLLIAILILRIMIMNVCFCCYESYDCYLLKLRNVALGKLEYLIDGETVEYNLSALPAPPRSLTKQERLFLLIGLENGEMRIIGHDHSNYLHECLHRKLKDLGIY